MDKRDDKRVHKIMRVNLQQAGKKILGSLLDVSTGGMKLRLLTRKQFLFNQKLVVHVAGKGMDYRVSGRVRWQKEDLVDRSHIVGVQFARLEDKFCEDVLNQELWSKALPYRCIFESRRNFIAEFKNNIKYGGLRIPLETEAPALYRFVHINLFPPGFEDPVPVFGEVVAHVPGGIGLRIQNHGQVLAKLKGFE